MEERLRVVYENKSTAELLEIYKVRGEYREDVAAFVEQTLSMRNLTSEEEKRFLNYSESEVVVLEEKPLGELDKGLKQMLKFINPLEPKSDNQLVWILLIPVIGVLYFSLENAFYLGFDWLTALVMGPDILLCIVLLYLLYHKKKWGLYTYLITILYKAFFYLSLVIAYLRLQFRYAAIDNKSESVNLDDGFSRLLFELNEVDYSVTIFWSLFNFILLTVLSRVVVMNRIKSIYGVKDGVIRRLYFWTSLILFVANTIVHIVFYT